MPLNDDLLPQDSICEESPQVRNDKRNIRRNITKILNAHCRVSTVEMRIFARELTWLTAKRLFRAATGSLHEA